MNSSEPSIDDKLLELYNQKPLDFSKRNTNQHTPVSKTLLSANQSAVSSPININKTVAEVSYVPLDFCRHLYSPQNKIDVESLPKSYIECFQNWCNDQSIETPVSAVPIVQNNHTSTESEKVIDLKLFTTWLNQHSPQAEELSSNEVVSSVKWYDEQINSMTETKSVSTEKTKNSAALMATIEKISKQNNTSIELTKRVDQENTPPIGEEVFHQATCSKANPTSTAHLNARTVTLKLINENIVEIKGNFAVGKTRKRLANMECLSAATQERIQEIRRCYYAQIMDALEKLKNLDTISKMCDQCCNADLEDMF
jgi:hypothetical protein